ncbi:MAG: hypothetical protein WCT45_03530 [Candidatus Paceibacterota bacterium]
MNRRIQVGPPRAFIAARHGDYDRQRNLSEAGREQMARLAAAVKEVVSGSSVPITLLCSAAPRAKQSGQILMDALNIHKDRAAFHDCLWVDRDHAGDWDVTKQLIGASLDDGALVLVVSHVDTIPSITRFVHTLFGIEGCVHETGYGRGFIVTPENMSIFPPA